MAARSRPRAGHLKEEVDEERSIWDKSRPTHAGSTNSCKIKLSGTVEEQIQQLQELAVQENTRVTETELERRRDEPQAQEVSTSEKLPVDDAGHTPGIDEHATCDNAGHASRTDEHATWNAIVETGKEVDQLMSQSDDLQAKILQLTAEQTARINRGDSPSSRVDDQLEEAIRENIRVCNTASDLIKSDSQQDLSFNLTILTAIRTSDDAEPPASRSASVGKLQRDRQNKRRLTDTIDDRESITTDSPGGPSPKVVIPPPKDRLIAKSGGSRAGSVPAVRESSVKAEDDKDDPGKESSRHRLIVGTDVLYRNNKYRNSEGEGILCRVTSVIGEGKQRRYEIIDADPDPPTPAVPYRASVNHLVAIPPPATNLTLPDLPSKRNVLALYPGTTTFYKAEVVSAWRGAAGVKKEDGSEEAGSANYVRLRFEGEDEADREMSVERRYVLPDR